jgi:hypothetical protein
MSPNKWRVFQATFFASYPSTFANDANKIRLFHDKIRRLVSLISHAREAQSAGGLICRIQKYSRTAQ